MIKNLKISMKEIFFSIILIGFIIIGFIMNYMISNNNRDITNFIAIVPLYIFCTILILMGRAVYEDACKKGLNPWFWSIIATVFFPAMIGLMAYFAARKSNFRSYKKKAKIMFIINMLLGIITSILITLFLNNIFEYLPIGISEKVNVVLVCLSPIFFFISLPMLDKFRECKHEMKDKFIKNIYTCIAFINIVPSIIAIFMLGLFGY